MNHAQDDLPIFVLWTAFLEWLLPTTGKFPKSVRFTFANRIDNLALDVIEDLIEARFRTDKLQILKRADLKLEKIRILLRLCHNLRYLSTKGYEYASRQLAEAGRMLGGWIRHKESK